VSTALVGTAATPSAPRECLKWRPAPGLMTTAARGLVAVVAGRRSVANTRTFNTRRKKRKANNAGQSASIARRAGHGSSNPPNGKLTKPRLISTDAGVIEPRGKWVQKRM
jgi:hypothetical protein